MLLFLLGCAICGGKVPLMDASEPPVVVAPEPAVVSSTVVSSTVVSSTVLSPTVVSSAKFRLILVGDTGKIGPIPGFISKAIAQEVASDTSQQTYVLALGDLFYPHPPLGEGCVDAVVARYQSYYGEIPSDRVLAVAGNHDVSSEEAESAAATACTEAAFQKMGWLKPGESLKSRQVVLQDNTGEKPFSIEIDLVEAGFFSEQHPEIPAFSSTATWQMIATHYVLSASFGKGIDEQGQFYGMPKGVVSDLWINGHAHQLEARMADARLAITSGGGAEFRTVGGFQADLYRKSPSLFTYARCPADATCETQIESGDLPPGLLPNNSQTGGYVSLDFSTLSPTQVKVTPVVCDVSSTCVQQSSYNCVKVPEGRGVRCG